MDPFIGEIRMFGGNYPPVNWAFCDGQLLPVSQNDALFSLIGDAFGGDVRTNFALPDMRGRIPVHTNTDRSQGLSVRPVGLTFGEEYTRLSIAQLPQHTHTFHAGSGSATERMPIDSVISAVDSADAIYLSGQSSARNPKPMSDATLQPSGHNQSHNNVMPCTCISFIISLSGVFPQKA